MLSQRHHTKPYEFGANIPLLDKEFVSDFSDVIFHPTTKKSLESEADYIMYFSKKSDWK